MKALSLMQPWASIVASGLKNIENRRWSTSFRGPVLIHASKTFDLDSLGFIKKTAEKLGILDQLPTTMADYPKGGIVGIMTITDCVQQSDDPWFFGPYGFVLKDCRSLPFVPCGGALNFWKVPEEVLTQLGLHESDLVKL